MSTLMTQARNRVPRFAESAVERARLSVVPPRRSQAPRAPFAVLVLMLLAGGVFGLLMFNTHMQQASFKASDLQKQADALVARQQSLNMELDALRDPQRLATAARELGMVAPSEPAFIQLGTGKVMGRPVAAGPNDAVRIAPLPRKRPAALAPKPIIVRVPAPITNPDGTVAAPDTQVGTPATSPQQTPPAGRKKNHRPATNGAAQ